MAILEVVKSVVERASAYQQYNELTRVCSRVAPMPADLRSNSEEANRFYQGQHRSDVEAYLRQHFPQSMARRSLVADVTNFTARLVERGANIWDETPRRTYLTPGGDELASDDKTVVALDSQEDQRIVGLRDLDRQSYLCQSGVLKIEWSKRHERLIYRVIPVSNVWVVPSLSPLADPDDPQELAAIIYRLPNAGDVARFCIWTYDTQLVYEGQTVDRPERIVPDDTNPTRRNPLGLLPFIIAREKDPGGYFFPPFDESLIDVPMQLNVAESLQTSNLWYQSHAPLIVPKGTSLEQAWGRDSAWEEPTDDGAAGQTRFLTKQTPFEEVAEHIKRKLRTFAMTRGLPANDFAFEGTSPESGFAKLIDSLPLIESRQNRIQRTGRSVEEQLVSVETAVLRFYRQPVRTDVTVDVDFGALAMPRSQEEVERVAGIKRTRQLAEIALGITTPAAIVADDEGVTIEEAQEILQERGVVETEDTADPDAID